MGNGSPDYTIGGLTATSKEHDRRIINLETEMGTMKQCIDRFKGSVSTLKWIALFVGFSSIVNFATVLVQSIR